MKKILIMGAGKIGSSIAKMLHFDSDYHITICDRSIAALHSFNAQMSSDIDGVQCEHLLPITDPDRDSERLCALMLDKDAVVSACSFTENKAIAAAAATAGISYFDLTEDVETTAFVRKVAEMARPGQIFMPQCGLAPGFIGILGHDMMKNFDKVDSLELRVGALPLNPTNMLKYNLTWSTAGLVNEYCNPSEVISDGKKIDVPALEGLERFSLNGAEYECFNTSGGLGTLCETLNGKVKSLNYKTIRYPGHRDLMNFLLNDLKLKDDRDNLIKILETALPKTLQDIVIVMVVARGYKDGQYIEKSDIRKIHGRKMYPGWAWSAIQITTAAGLCAVLDMHMTSPLADKGFVSQEKVCLHPFLNNRFGRFYDPAL